VVLMSNLKPCPFCGGEADRFGVSAEREGDYVNPIAPGCDSCQAYVFAKTHDEAIAAWNRRAAGWVSVEERLPENIRKQVPYDSQQLLVALRDGTVLMGFLCDERWYDANMIDEELFTVTHWMPLPEPPEVKP
jgi:Lar family restriction alleviation protein